MSRCPNQLSLNLVFLVWSGMLVTFPIGLHWRRGPYPRPDPGDPTAKKALMVPEVRGSPTTYPYRPCYPATKGLLGALTGRGAVLGPIWLPVGGCGAHPGKEGGGDGDAKK